MEKFTSENDVNGVEQLEDMITDFYAVEHMYWSLKFPKLMALFPEFYGKAMADDNYPHNIELSRLVNDLAAWRESFHPLFARTLRDSLAGMGMGEARHATEWDRYQGEIELDNFFSASDSRSYVYRSLDGQYSLDDVETVCEVFEDGNWSSDFGGAAWAEIMQHSMKYGQLDDTVFVDTVVHAVHNGGCAFDKGLLVRVDSPNKMGRLLDAKFDGSIFDYQGQLTVSKAVYNMIKRTNTVFKNMGWGYYMQTRSMDDFNVRNKVKFYHIDWSLTSVVELEYNEDRQRHEYEECYDCGETYDYCECNEY
jgi:hypothetical protein